MGERTTDGAAQHFSIYYRIPPVFSAVFMRTSVIRVMAGPADGARSVPNLLWQETPAEHFTISADSLGDIRSDAGFLDDEGSCGLVIRGEVMEGVADLATDLLASDANGILPQFLTVDLLALLREMVVGEAMAALKLLPVRPDPVRALLHSVDTVLTKMIERPALDTHFLFAQDINWVLTPRLIFSAVFKKMVCDSTEITTIEL